MTIVAVDFGTTNTIISYLPEGTETPTTVNLKKISRVFPFVNINGETEEVAVIPSVLFIDENHQPQIGQLVQSQKLGLSNPQRFFQGFKRDLAADYQPPKRDIDGVFYTAEKVGELFITALWQELQDENIHPTKVVFTVPVGAFERYRDWFWQLGEKLNIPQLQLVDESTAAALGYAQKKPNSLVLVIDFGGGTLNLSLVRTAFSNNADELKGEVIAKADAYVGGKDIDCWIVQDYLHSIGSYREDLDEITWQHLLEIAENMKIKLSTSEEARESWQSYELSLQREKLEEILESHHLLDELREGIDDIVSIGLRKGITKGEIEQVLLTGGSSLIPAVQQLVISFFGPKKVRLEHPFAAVSHGALGAAKLQTIQDYLSHSYAIRLWEPSSQGYHYHKLFESGTSYPCQGKTLTLQVAVEEQTEVELDIGELAEVSQTGEVSYDSLGRMTSSSLTHETQFTSLAVNRQQVCVAHLEPPGKIGRDRLAVTFAVNQRRVLVVTVTDLLTQQVLIDNQEVIRLS